MNSNETIRADLLNPCNPRRGYAAAHATMLLVEASLLALYVSDRRAGIREWPYVGTLVFFVLWQGIMGPLATSDLFANFASWLTAPN